MHFTDIPSLGSPRQGHRGDDLDGLLSRYFHAQIPSPWPDAPAVGETPVLPMRKRSGTTLSRSRLVLAASVAFLLLLPWLVADTFRSLPVSDGVVPSMNDGTADKSLRLRGTIEVQPNGETGIKIEVDELPPPEKKIMDDINDQLR